MPCSLDVDLERLTIMKFHQQARESQLPNKFLKIVPMISERPADISPEIGHHLGVSFTENL